MKKRKTYFTRAEQILWSASAALILVSFLIYDRENYMTLGASLLGVTSLIFNAKGNPAGQALMVIFSILYGVISYSCAYYGEMITYLGMTGPMALYALISWLRNPFQGKRAQVAVNRIGGKEWCLMAVLTAAVTLAFYYILEAFDTARIGLSTLSVTTSFIAVYLTSRRSAWFAMAYAANDVVLILLWILASLEDRTYISVVICFAVFFVNDLYGFFSWKRMEKYQLQENRCGS